MPKVEVSWGELLDKFSILEIKLASINNNIAKVNIQKEKNSLEQEVLKCFEFEKINELFNSLLQVNQDIWNGMDRIFEIGEAESDNYLIIVRNVTALNKRRSYIKKEIDEICKSDFSEEKSYF
jgi:hypothetical protein